MVQKRHVRNVYTRVICVLQNLPVIHVRILQIEYHQLIAIASKTIMKLDLSVKNAIEHVFLVQGILPIVQKVI